MSPALIAALPLDVHHALLASSVSAPPLLGPEAGGIDEPALEAVAAALHAAALEWQRLAAPASPDRA